MAYQKYIHGTYSRHLFDRGSIKKIAQKVASKIKEALKTKQLHNFQAIAFTGISGTLVAPFIAHTLKKTLILIRKEDGHHSCYGVEGDMGALNYIILDDFIDSGKTIKKIINDINGRGSYLPKHEMRCVGIALYDEKFRKDSFWVDGLGAVPVIG